MSNDKDNETIGSFYMGRMRPPPPPPKRVMPKGALTIVAIIAFAAIIWYAYPQGQEKYEGADVPVIKADAAPYKFKPEDPGGMEVRHQDSTIFDPLEKKAAADPEVEKLMPTPEEPVDKDAAVNDKAMLEPTEPKLNLDTQMQKVADGTEKVVFPKVEAPAVKETVAVKPTPKPAAKQAEKTTVPEKVKEEKTKEEKITEAVKQPVKEPAVPSGETKAPAGINWDTYIRLGSYRNTAGAKEDWAVMKKKYPQFLGGLNMRIVPVDLGSKGTFNRLEAGKLSDTRAREICEALGKSNPGGCIVVK